MRADLPIFRKYEIVIFIFPTSDGATSLFHSQLKNKSPLVYSQQTREEENSPWLLF